MEIELTPYKLTMFNAILYPPYGSIELKTCS